MRYKMTLIGKYWSKLNHDSLGYKILFALRFSKWGIWVWQTIYDHRYLSDKKKISLKYKQILGVSPNLDHPKNFNEKNNWRKLHDRKPIYTLMADKYRVKEIIKERCGQDHTFPLLGVWNHPEDIDFDSLPEKFVLKCNHAGGVIVCRNKSQFDKKRAIRELNIILNTNYFLISRVWPYKNIERKIVCEEYMGENLTDYKNYCFNGELKYTLVWENESRTDGRKPKAYFCGMYDQSWKKTDMRIDYPSKMDIDIPKPEVYDTMVSIAEKMSKDSPFARVDCYIINNQVYVGEITFAPWGGFQKFITEEWNDKLGEMQIL